MSSRQWQANTKTTFIWLTCWMRVCSHHGRKCKELILDLLYVADWHDFDIAKIYKLHLDFSATRMTFTNTHRLLRDAFTKAVGWICTPTHLWHEPCTITGHRSEQHRPGRWQDSRRWGRLDRSQRCNNPVAYVRATGTPCFPPESTWMFSFISIPLNQHHNLFAHNNVKYQLDVEVSGIVDVRHHSINLCTDTGTDRRVVLQRGLSQCQWRIEPIDGQHK